MFVVYGRFSHEISNFKVYIVETTRSAHGAVAVRRAHQTGKNARNRSELLKQLFFFIVSFMAMIKMHRLLLCALVACACAQNDGDLDSVIKQIFGEPNNTQNNFGGNVQSTQAPTTSPAPTQPTNQDTSCTTQAGEVGECVQYYLCDSNNTIITDGVGIIDIRVRDGPCESYLEVCCLLADRRQPDNPITPSPDPTQPTRSGCGLRNPNGVGFRITGESDSEAKFGEFPWMVAILKIEPVNANDPDSQRLNVYVGGGSLIHPSVVLTAAHYVNNVQNLRVRAGEWDTQTKNELYPFQDRDVTDIVVHKDYNSGTLYYDAAILFLESPMQLAPNVGVVCLPAPNERPRANTRCFASGWGKDQFGKEGRYQVILKKVDVPVVEHNTCQDRLRRTRLGRFFTLHSSFMCAGGEPGKDTCKGDGGSPLVCPMEVNCTSQEYDIDPRDGGKTNSTAVNCTSQEYDLDPRVEKKSQATFEPERYQQNGIVAWGIGCGEDGTPGVYVDVAKVRTWIDNEVAAKSYDISVYTV